MWNNMRQSLRPGNTCCRISSFELRQAQGVRSYHWWRWKRCNQAWSWRWVKMERVKLHEMSPCHVLMGGSDINVMIFMKYIFRMIWYDTLHSMVSLHREGCDAFWVHWWGTCIKDLRLALLSCHLARVTKYFFVDPKFVCGGKMVLEFYIWIHILSNTQKRVQNCKWITEVQQELCIFYGVRAVMLCTMILLCRSFNIISRAVAI